MESRNFHHHHQQQQQDHELLVDSSPFSTSSCYGLSWSQDPILINTTNNSNLVPCLNTSTPLMVQNMGFPWSTTSNNNGTNNINVENFMTHHEFQRVERIKNELSVSESYPKFSELINNSPTSSIEDLHTSPKYSKINDHHQQITHPDNNQDLLLSNFSNGCHIKGGHLITQFASSGELISYSNINDDNNSQNSSRGSFSQIFPTINISSLSQSSSSAEGNSSTSFDMNFPALDLFDSPKFSESFTHPSSLNTHSFGGLLKGTCLPYGLDQVHRSNHRQAVCPSKISSAFNTGSTEAAKRPASNYMNSKATHSSAPKKSKLDSRPSCTPFKVRKEKLGDRIAALQQLVAPFGKTDTASVLMEAIGYINFLQNQVETLSVPYMKSAHKTSKTATRGSSMENENEDEKRDLRSRGLCLVPVSCLSYVTDGGGGIWRNP